MTGASNLLARHRARRAGHADPGVPAASSATGDARKAEKTSIVPAVPAVPAVPTGKNDNRELGVAGGYDVETDTGRVIRIGDCGDKGDNPCCTGASPRPRSWNGGGDTWDSAPISAHHKAPYVLTYVAQQIQDALDEGADREEAGTGIMLIRPDGRHVMVPERIVQRLIEHQLLPPLPPVLPASYFSAVSRPPSWSEVADKPCNGDRCCCCGGRSWWRERANPTGWRCSVCHPHTHLGVDEAIKVMT